MRLFFHVVVHGSDLVQILGLEDLVAVEAPHIVHAVPTHQKLRTLMFAAWHSKQNIPILKSNVRLSSPYLVKTSKGFHGSAWAAPPCYTAAMHKLFLAALLLASTVFAAPNLTGDWKLNIAKSQYGAMPAPVAVTRKIKQAGVDFSMSTFQKTAQREGTSELHYTTDGKECVNKVANGESKGTAFWAGDNLVIESSQQIQGADLKSREIWSLSADGKTLTITTHLTLPQQGELDVKQVFEKQ